MAKSLKSKTTNQIMYISIGCVIAIIILFVIILSVFNKKQDNQSSNMQIGDNSNQSETNVEEASSSIGKTIAESENYVEVNENEPITVQTNNGEDVIEQAEVNNNIDGGLGENVAENSQGESTIQSAENEIVNNELTTQTTENENNNAETVSEQNNAQEIQVIDENISSNADTPKDPVFVMPVDGEIVKQYGKDKLIYSDTLKEWTTHLGIDIKADKTTIVKSSSDGCVKSIKNDPRYGLTVVIEHENGFTSVYSNLLTAEFVVVGENVKSGQTIGTVGNSATFEILDEPHLHFEILKDGNSIDPEMYIK